MSWPVLSLKVLVAIVAKGRDAALVVGRVSGRLQSSDCASRRVVCISARLDTLMDELQDVNKEKSCCLQINAWTTEKQ